MIYLLVSILVLVAAFLYACCKIASLSDDLIEKDETKRRKK